MRLLTYLAFLLAVTACDRDPSPEATDNDVEATTEGDVAASIEDDPFFMGSTAARVAELGLPSPAQVHALATRAEESFQAGDCEAAIPALEEHARQANWLANIIAGGLQPFYRASYEERRQLRPADLQTLVPLESLANRYKQDRNRSMVMAAECLVRTGDQSRGMVVLMNALRMIPVDDSEWWERSRQQLYQLVAVVDSTGRRLPDPGLVETAASQ